MDAPVTVSRDGAIAIIALARPAVFNCLSLRALQLIREGLWQAEADADVRVVLIRAEGRHFCTGADLAEFGVVRDQGEAALRAFTEAGHATLAALEASRLPIVAAVQGLCLAGGLELMLACDIVIAATGARFGDQHGKFGLIPGWGGSQRLPRAVGLRRAMDLFLGVRWIEAERAEQWGLINAVVAEAELEAAALAYCAGIASRSPSGMALMKRLARDGLEGSLAEGLRREREAVVPALRSAAVTEGLAAFAGRRDPVF